MAARSDVEAFGVFYDRRIGELLGFLRRRGMDVEVAFDIAGETFAVMLADLARFRPELGGARAWMFGIARNKLLESVRAGRVEDRVRRELAMAPVELDEDDVAFLEAMAVSPALELLEDLPAEQRDAITWRHIDGREYADIASEIRCSESVVRKRVSRGMGVLRERFREVMR